MTEEVLYWGDVESTGVDERPHKAGDRLLQIYMVATDLELNLLDEGYEAIVFHSQEEAHWLREGADPFVKEMHDKTGLWDRLPRGKWIRAIDSELLSYMAEHSEPKSSRLVGNSITLDRNFMREFLPKSFGHLHYRSIDVSSLGEAIRLFGSKDDVYHGKDATHDAKDDILRSIDQLKHYRSVLFG